MHANLLIALFAFLGAAAAGLLGACVLLLIRRRSLALHLGVVVEPPVCVVPFSANKAQLLQKPL